MATRPNIVVILSDDQGYWTLGCGGNPEIQTPNLDRLAARGTRLTNFFCTSPVCSPARASLLTGRIPSQHGIHDWLRAGNAPTEKESGARPIEYLRGQIGYTDILAENAYDCGLSGKWHLGDSLTPQKGFSFWEVHAAGAGPYYAAPMVRNGEIYTADGYVTDVITDNALRFLDARHEARRAVGSDAAFYLSVHYTAPHSPWERHHHPPELFDAYHGDCSFESFPEEPPHPWQTSVFCPQGDREKRRELLSGYCAALTAMDRNIGRILDRLEEMGAAEDTLIFFSSDNGMNMGHHGIYGKGNGTFPLNMFDTSVKVPAILSYPGRIPEGETCDALLSQYDFLPTLLDFAGLPNPAAGELPGRSFAALLTSAASSDRGGGSAPRRASPADRDFVVVYDEYGPVRMVRTRDWKYIHRYPYGPHELYDLTADPDEKRNLYKDPGERARVDELREMLEAWFTEYAEPERDGVRQGVTGRGQIHAVGPAGGGARAFMDDWRYACDPDAPDPGAEALNRDLEGTIAGRLLSDLGRRLYLPKGLVVQAAEARERARRANATIGMATQGGEPIHLPSVKRLVPDLTPAEIFAYAPAPGVEELRRLWRVEMGRKNPDLDLEAVSNPLVVPGLTHALSAAADLFLDRGDPVVIPELYWENYRLIFTVRRGARLLTYPLLYGRNRLNVQAIGELLDREQERAAAESRSAKAALLFNFPNNPTGYSPTVEEAADLVDTLRRRCERGMRILAIVDDAYFGLFYEKRLFEQSLFTPLSALHPNLLAVKVDGPTKEDLAWGFRVGFITFGSAGLGRPHYDALQNKVTGGIRSLVSNSSRLSQSLLIRAMTSGSYASEKRKTFEILEQRYAAVKRVVEGGGVPSGVRVLPFNSGYFMTLELESACAEEIRARLLAEKGIGTIALGDRHLRIAYSCVDTDELDGVLAEIFRAIAAG